MSAPRQQRIRAYMGKAEQLPYCNTVASPPPPLYTAGRIRYTVVVMKTRGAELEKQKKMCGNSSKVLDTPGAAPIIESRKQKAESRKQKAESRKGVLCPLPKTV